MKIEEKVQSSKNRKKETKSSVENRIDGSEGQTAFSAGFNLIVQG